MGVDSWAARESESVRPHFTCSPDIRAPIREDFPMICDRNMFEHFVGIIKKQLQKAGTSLEACGDIAIVYPQSIRSPARAARMRELAVDVQNAIANSMQLSIKKFPIADDIYQMHTRSGEVHGNYERQRFASATAFSQQDKRKYFILVDDALTTGATMANLASYVESHDGKVVGAFSNDIYGRVFIASDPEWIRTCHSSAAHNAAECGFNGADRAELTTPDEQAWAQKAADLKTLGLNIFHLTGGEQGQLKHANLTRQVQNAAPAGLTDEEKTLLVGKIPNQNSSVGRLP